MNATLRWLEDVLKHSHSNELFMITGHAPSVVNTWESSFSIGWKDAYMKEYARIMTEYSDKIMVNFAGHFHTFKMSLPLYHSKGSDKSYMLFNL